ncbi:MAG: hypothetical protein P9L89_05880 [Candidatus Celaenobacter polaris]|nr:hypothetical protein [Candidatus Celaenobacter polaris]
MKEQFLPATMKTPTLPVDWNPEDAVKTVNKLTAIAKPVIADIITTFWIAHETLIRNEILGWTWKRFCKETNYAENTPLNWFRKYNISFTNRKIAFQQKIFKNFKINSSEERKNYTAKPIVEEQEIEHENSCLPDTEITHKPERRKREYVEKASSQESVNNFSQLRNHWKQTIEGLKSWADGAIKPETELDTEHARLILSEASNLIMQLNRLGIDIPAIIDTHEVEKSKAEEEKVTDTNKVEKSKPEEEKVEPEESGESKEDIKQFIESKDDKPEEARHVQSKYHILKK